MLSGGDDAGQEPATVPPGAVAPAEPAVEGTAQAGGEAKEGQEGAASGAPTMAVDERALDSFFSDQDLGDERRTGRLRHRH
jgi:hypothetical protein